MVGWGPYLPFYLLRTVSSGSPMLNISGSSYAFKVGLDMLRSTIVVDDASEEEEDPVVAIILNVRVIKPAIAAITMITVATSTSDGGRLEEVFFVVLVSAAVDVIIFNFITKLTIVPSLHKQC